MFNHKSTKSAIFILVAVLMVATVMFAACNSNEFQPVTAPESAKPEGNGGNAVKYGEWIYYVNGYQSSASEENTYAQLDGGRIGAIARIKVEDLESLFAVYDNTSFTTGTARTNEIARIVKEKAQIVVPKFYYSGNSTSTNVNGIYIFNDRLYILTPNDQLTAGGNKQTSQNVLTSFKLDGSDEQRHYTFTTNSAQVMLAEIESKLLATYIMGTEVGCIDVASGNQLVKIDKTSSAQLDVAGNAVVYIKDKAICKLNAGATEGKVLVNNTADSHVSYTISNVNNGYVYYTKADSDNSSIDGTCVYYAKEGSEEGSVAWKSSAPSSNWYGYNETIVYTTSETVNGITLYGIYVLEDNAGSNKTQIVNPVQNDSSITFNRIEGNILYYTSNSVAYKVDLSKKENPTPIGRSLASASGWSVPDVVNISGKDYNYVITLSSGSVSAVKFNTAKKENSSSVTLTIPVPVVEE